MLCGMLACWKLAKANSDGSSEGMFGPNCVTMPPPELTPLPPESATEPGIVHADALQADALRSRGHAQLRRCATLRHPRRAAAPPWPAAARSAAPRRRYCSRSPARPRPARSDTGCRHEVSDVHARRVRQTDGRNAPRLIGMREPTETSGGRLHADFRLRGGSRRKQAEERTGLRPRFAIGST